MTHLYRHVTYLLYITAISFDSAFSGAAGAFKNMIHAFCGPLCMMADKKLKPEADLRLWRPLLTMSPKPRLYTYHRDYETANILE